MEWYIILLILLGGLLLIMFSGIPVAFAFFVISAIVMFLGDHFGMTASGWAAIRQLMLGMRNQLANFSFTPIPFFVIMGEVFFQSGIIQTTLDALSKLVRKVPGRLSVVTLLGGGIFAALSGSSLGNTAMFGSLMMPEMTRRGYSKELTTGSIMAGGGLAMIIPPSNQAVLLGGIAGISVGRILVGAIIPGLLLLTLYITYVLVRCIRNPNLAPKEDLEDQLDITRLEKLTVMLKNVLPLLLIFALIIGVIFTGVGTATEAAALGALASYVLVMAYRRFSFKLLVGTLVGSLRTSGMLMIIIAGSVGFSQVMSLSGASRAMVLAVTQSVDSQWLMLLVMLAIVFVLGLFIEQASIMMICLPLFMPLVTAFEINEIWFAIMFLILLEVGQFTPPVGLSLFTMKSVSPPEVTMKHIVRGAIPFVGLDFAAVILILLIPPLATFIPGLM
jgi:tripartite ATP-independent transporter DctM subunit